MGSTRNLVTDAAGFAVITSVAVTLHGEPGQITERKPTTRKANSHRGLFSGLQTQTEQLLNDFDNNESRRSQILRYVLDLRQGTGSN